MKAVILAGGRGERLRPITDTRPKPLCTVLARPVMDYTLSLLSHHGIKEAAVTTFYLADKIEKTYGSGKFGVKLCYAEEKIPLGTAGSVRLCKDFIGEDEDFLVISGDAVCDFDLTDAIRFHKEKGAEATIILSSVKSPLEYGVVISGKAGEINSFAEKPDWSEALSDSVNTGVYILSSSVFDMIPSGREFDFSGDLFPKMLSEKKKIYGYKDSGYWCDIGKIPQYYKCNLDLLNERFKVHTSLGGKIMENEKGRYFISDNSFVNDGAMVGADSVISDGATISDGAVIKGSIVMEDVSVQKGAVVKDSIVCEKSSIGEDAVVCGDSVLAKGTKVSDDASIHSEITSADSNISGQSAFSSAGEFLFTENGAEYKNTFLDIDATMRLGKAFGAVFDEKILVMHDRSKPESKYFASFFISGVQSAGRDICDIGAGDMQMCSFAAAKLAHPAVYITSQRGGAEIHGFEKDSFPLLRKTTVRLSKTDTSFDAEKFGKLEKYEGIENDYISAVSEEMGAENKFMLGILGNERAEMLKKSAIKKGFSAYYEKKENMLSISLLGNALEVFLGDERIFDTQRARLFVIKEMLIEGRRSFILPDTAPFIYSETIEKTGGSVQFYSAGHTAKEESGIRLAASKERWLYDSIFLAAKIIKYASGLGERVMRNVFSSVPAFYISTLFYSSDDDTRLKVVGQAIPQFHGRKIRILPEAHAIRIISEAQSFEAALDNAFECRGKLNEIEQKIKGR